jgi:hypothetical protein
MSIENATTPGQPQTMVDLSAVYEEEWPKGIAYLSVTIAVFGIYLLTINYFLKLLKRAG